MAAGSLDTDAVNVAQLKKVQNLAGKHTKVTVEGGTDAGTTAKDGTRTYTGTNLKLNQLTDENGATVYDLKLADAVTIGGKDGADGTNGVDGHIGVRGNDGEKGANGRDAVSIDGKDGNEGHIGLKGKDGEKGKDGQNAYSDITTHFGPATLNPDKNVKIIKDDGETDAATRLHYVDQNHKEHEVATMDDGLTFVGDDGQQIKKYLNEELTIKGGAKTADKDGHSLLTDGNIGVVKDNDGNMVVKLAKDVKDLSSITIKNTATTQGTTDVTIDGTGIHAGGKKVTNVGAGEISDTSTDAINGSQLYKVQQKAEAHTKVTVEGGTDAGTTAKDGTRTYTGTNLKLNQLTDENGATVYDLKLADAVTIGGKDGADGTNGVDGHIGVRGNDGEKGANGRDAVSIDGKDGNEGHIGLKGKDGEKGKDGQNAYSDITTHFGPATLNPDKNVKIIKDDGETDAATRLHYVDQNHKEHEVATMDDGLTFVGDDGQQIKKYLNEELTIKGGAKTADKDGHSLLTDGNIGVVKDNDGNMVVKLAKDVKDLSSITIKNTATTQGTTDVTIDGTGIHAGGKKVTNVGAGEISDTSTDAVNGSQLNKVKTLAGQHTTVEAGSKNVSVMESTNDAGGKKYTVDLAKDVTFGDAAKGDKTVAISGTDGTITAGTGDNKVTVDGSKGQIVAGGNNGVKIGNIENGDSSLTIYDKDGKATGKTDKAGKYVTNLDNKTWNTDGSYVSGRAATEDQLHQVESNVNKKFDDVNTKIESVDKHHTEVTVNGGTAAKADGSYTDGNLQIAQKTGSDGHQKIYDLKLSDNLNIGGAGKDGAPGKDGHMGINGADGKSGVGIDGKDGISIKGKDGQNGVTIKGVDGKDGTEGHIGLTGPKGADGQNATADIYVKNGQNGVDGTDGHGGKAGMDRVVYEDHNHITHEVATMDDGMKYSGDSGNAAVKLNKNVQIYGGATEYADGNNIGVVASQDGDNAKLQVKLAKDLKGINSIEAKTITTGNTTINNSGLTVKGDDNHKDITIQQGNVNMGGNTIEGVAPGAVTPDSTDAVNGSQLYAAGQAISNLGGAVNKLGTRVDRVGAGAAALAALHPLDFDPDDKWDFAAGYGNYRGANAAAVGAYYRPNEDTMFSIGGSFGGGENMVNAGVSFKLGQGNHVSTSRVAMAKEIKDLRENVAQLNQIVNRQSALIEKLTSVDTGSIQDKGNDLFPDVPENHWAYEYVTKLAKAGILKGYPDGKFAGDRMMTRYEFAAIVYRAITMGAASDPGLNQDGTLGKLAKEFNQELKFIRIDTIHQTDQGEPTVQRVRVQNTTK